jgi:hypothetical protein
METGRLSSQEFDAYVDQILSICADGANMDLREIFVRNSLRRLLNRHTSCVEMRWRGRIKRLEAQLAETRNHLESEVETAARQRRDLENQVLALQSRFESEAQVWALRCDASSKIENQDILQQRRGSNRGDATSLPPQRQCHDLPQRPFWEASGKENIDVVALSPKPGPGMNESVASECPKREVRRALTAQLVQRAPLQPQIHLARSLSPNRDIAPMLSPQCSASRGPASAVADMGSQNARSSPRGCGGQPNLNPRSSPVRKSGGLNTGSFAPPRRQHANPQVPQGPTGSFGPPCMVSSAPHLLRPSGSQQYMGLGRAHSQVIRLPSHAAS